MEDSQLEWNWKEGQRNPSWWAVFQGSHHHYWFLNSSEAGVALLWALESSTSQGTEQILSKASPSSADSFCPSSCSLSADLASSDWLTAGSWSWQLAGPGFWAYDSEGLEESILDAWSVTGCWCVLEKCRMAPVQVNQWSWEVEESKLSGSWDLSCLQNKR